MRRGRVVTAVVCTVLSVSVLGFWDVTTEEVSAYTPHSPIFIEFNSGFTAANGVTGGNGTSTDPFIIEGWEITASSADGIRLSTTSAWVIIRNVYVHGGSTTFDGIRLWGSYNVRIENCTLSTNLHGIRIDFSTADFVNNTISSNYEDGIWIDTGGGLIKGNSVFSNVDDGIQIQNGGSGRVMDNNITANGKLGIRFDGADDSLATGNRVSFNGGIGIGIGNSENITAIANNLSSNQECVWNTNTMDAKIIGNSCTDHSLSIRIDTSTLVTVMGNNLTDNLGGINTYHSDYVNIIGNNFTNSSGVSLDDDSNNFLVKDNSFVNGGRIHSTRNRNNAILNNSLFDFQGDIEILDCNNYTISGNTMLYENGGIRLRESQNITVRGNTFAGYGISISGASIWDWNSHVIDSSNTVAGAPVLYWKNGTGGAVPPGVSQVIVANYTDAIIQNLDFAKVHKGVQIGFSSGVTVANSTFSVTYFGIHVYESDGNTIANNTVLSDTYDVYIEVSANNNVYHNNFIDPSPYPWDDTDQNQWDDDYPSGGNYWSDYAGIDDCSGPNQDICPDPDGIGDTPYIVDADSEDRYPLMSPHGTLLLRPPSQIGASLSGQNLENVSITWALSLDDGSGFNTVVGYRIYGNTTYEPGGLGYGLVATTPNGVDLYDDVSAGEGNPDDYLYRVCSFDILNNETCALNQAGKSTRQLTQGMNLVSIPLVQMDESAEKVLQTLRFDKAWAYDSASSSWESFMSFKPYEGQLRNIDHRMGVWVNVLEDSNLTVAGVVPLQTSIQLRSGWNLVGYPSFISLLTVELKASLGATRVEGFDSASPPFFVRLMLDGDILQTGSGYWVRVAGDITWTVKNF